MREELRKLARLTGHPSLDVFFQLTLAKALDPVELEKLRIKRHVFLARYGRQSMLQWDNVDGRRVRIYADALAEFLREEAEAVAKATANAAAK